MQTEVKPPPRTELIEIDSLKPHPRKELFKANPETVQNLAEEIKTHGFTHPITITKQRVILSGHKRVEACRLLGMKFIPAYIIPKSESAGFLYFIRQNTLPEPVTRENRLEIYRHFCKEVFFGKSVREEKMRKLCSMLAISSATVKSDFAHIRRGEVSKITVDLLQEVWQTKLASPKITFASCANGWICQISDRNFSQGFGAKPTFKELVREVFDAGKSRHFQTFKMSPEAIESGKQIKAIREKYAVNQKELAQALGKGQATVSEWEAGLINITPDRIRQIEQACQRIAGVYDRE